MFLKSNLNNAVISNNILYFGKIKLLRTCVIRWILNHSFKNKGWHYAIFTHFSGCRYEHLLKSCWFGLAMSCVCGLIFWSQISLPMWVSNILLHLKKVLKYLCMSTFICWVLYIYLKSYFSLNTDKAALLLS